MELSVKFENTRDVPESDGPVTVGWILKNTPKSVVYDPPQRVRSIEMSRTHAKSASRCPAIINLESRYFEIPCPFDLNLGFIRNTKGQVGLKNLAGEKSPIRKNKIGEVMHVVNEAEWRYKDRPTIQMKLPYLFISDEPVYLSQIAPFMHYPQTRLPGTIFGGRFPINVWPRSLMWAFEWHDVKAPLVLKRGDPLFYVQLETAPQNRAVRLIEAEQTPELKEYLDMISGAVEYVNQTFSLFEKAEARRPETLVKAVMRK